MTPEE